MEPVLFSLLLLAALALLGVVLVMGRRRPARRERKRLTSPLGVSAARKEAWETPQAPAPLGGGRYAEEAAFLPHDMAEIERLLSAAHAQELSAQDGRMLGVLEGIVGRRVRLVAVGSGEDETFLVFADSTEVALEGVGRERREQLRKALPTQVVLADVSYAAPSILLTFRMGTDTMLLGASRARLV